MHFSNSALALAFSVIAGPIVTSAFTTPGTAFVSKSVPTTGVVSITNHVATNCNCFSCGMKTLLRMSDSVEEDVPPEVEAMDGVDSEEEAHNTERPARDSGIKKHKKGGNKGIALDDLEVGSFVDGTVKTITSYGAFVDIGAKTDALLHVSRLSNEFVSNVEDIVKAGDSVSVRIVSVDTEKGQVAVSMLSQDAEDKAAEGRSRGAGGRRKERPQRSQGDRAAQVKVLNELNEAGFDSSKFVDGEVVSTLAFGAFVRFSVGDLVEGIEGELDGLVHISALSAGRASSVEEFASVGDKVKVRVRSVDAEGNKVSLSMITEEEEAASRPAPRKSDEDKPRRRGRAMFSDSELGPSDWKESLENVLQDAPTFSNAPVVVDKRKSAVSA